MSAPRMGASLRRRITSCRRRRKSIVIEYVGGKLNVYDNPLGVITNSPRSIGT